jgi:hypothetical protein
VNRSIFALIAATMFSACGTMPEDRAVSGAALGTGAGLVVGAITGLTLLEGAALGAVGGALTGVLTDPDRVNFGRPVWQNGTAAAHAGTGGVRSASPVGQPGNVVAEIQAGLARLGYDPGPIDGIAGPRTRSAIRAYQQDHGLVVDGRASANLAMHILARTA